MMSRVIKKYPRNTRIGSIHVGLVNASSAAGVVSAINCGVNFCNTIFLQFLQKSLLLHTSESTFHQ